LLPNDFYLNQHNFGILNSFAAPSQMNQTPNYQQLFENNFSIFDQFAMHEKQKLDSLRLANEMCPSINNVNNLNNQNKSSSSSDMSNKLNIINQLAKQIDSLNEATCKGDKKEKRKEKLSKKKSKESNDECCSANCSDLACCKCLIRLN